MKLRTITVIFLVLSPLLYVWSQESAKMSSTMKHAVRYGADAMMTFNVKDSCGQPCTNVAVSVFAYAAYGKKGETTVIHTDTNGLAVITLKTTGGIKYHVEGDRYYKTVGEFTFLKNYDDWVRDGKWQPWNATIEVKLKEKRNPIPMIVKRVRIRLPKHDKPLGFDLMKCDLVAPFGHGIHSDLLLTSTFEKPRSSGYLDFRKRLSISTPKAGGGIVRAQNDTWSELGSVYEAPDGDYLENLDLCIDRTPSKVLEAAEVKQDEYLIIRTRIESDDNGNILSAQYGKIYGWIDFGPLETKGESEIRFLYYFNPTPNDRNLEFDGQNNLLNPNDRIPIP